MSAELEPEEKAQVSHRALAMKILLQKLKLE
jgi:inosine/xanthosine triphosphate pyrophosphatase family protein